MATETSAPTGYESPSWWYDLRGFFILKLSYRGSLLRQVRFFSQNIGPRHLEAAIGSGTLFSMILGWRAFKGLKRSEIVGFDYADQMLAGARRRFKGRPHIQLLAANAHHLPFESESFDTINVANAIHCFSDLNRALSEMHRVLKPRGRLATNVLIHPRGGRLQQRIAQAINNWGRRKGILYTAYDPHEFRERAESAGFRVLSDEVQGNAYFIVLEKPADSGE